MSFELSGDYLTLILRVLVAAVLGGLIGLERDVHGRAAGLRTHLLVSMGAAVFTVLSEVIGLLRIFQVEAGQVTFDPGRIAAQVVTGIGFLGAGAILKDGLTVRGLTTAACLWVAAAVGMACGAGFFNIAFAATLFAIVALVLLKGIERLYPKDTYRTLTVVTTMETEIGRLVETVRTKSIHVLFVDFERNYETGTMTAHLAIRLFERSFTEKRLDDVVGTLETAGIPLKSIKWAH